MQFYSHWAWFPNIQFWFLD
uniref:Uncharacterized protein n=1 Tax=Arundo donax TaxID=35708 RepID=A0A0A8ZUF7_ARUDO